MLEGSMRTKLREAIFAGFNTAALDEVLRDNDMFRPNVSTGPDFATHVNSLIDVADQESWLIELCGVLAAARSRNKPVSSAILSVQAWLTEQRQTNGSTLDGKMRAKLREAILMGFDRDILNRVLRENDMFSYNVPDDTFLTYVSSLIDVAFQEGWLVELCAVLAAERVENKPVHATIVSVQKRLIGQVDTNKTDLHGLQKRAPVHSAGVAPSVASRDTYAIDPQFRQDADLLSKSNPAQLSAQEHAVSWEGSWAEFFFSFKGRISRKSFWLGFLTILIVAVLLYGTLALLLGTAAFELKDDVSQPTRLFKNIYWLMGVLLYWPIFALIMKRLHDFGQGRAFAWLFAILSVLYKIADLTGPEDVRMVTLAIFVTVLAMLGSVRGSFGPNEYGPDPKRNFESSQRKEARKIGSR
jgi:uncharacterized membrane protein YhaH (DUF805 family)